jgi:hypothetical protein
MVVDLVIYKFHSPLRNPAVGISIGFIDKHIWNTSYINVFLSLSLTLFPLLPSPQNWYSYQFTCFQVLEFLKSKENCISLLLKHLGTSAIMDLLLKLITCIEGAEMKQNILNVSISSNV